jgi:protein SHQ1
MESGAGPAAEAAEAEDPDEWEWDQQLAPEAAAASDLLGRVHYGFNGAYAEFFKDISPTSLVESDVIDVPQPEAMGAAARRAARIAHEDAKFDPEHFLADTFDDDYVRETLAFEPRWARHAAAGEQDAELAQTLGQLQPFVAAFPQECMDQLASFGPT